MIRVASIQMRIADAEKGDTLKRASELIDGIGEVDLILLPELWNVGYFAFDSYGAKSERLDGPTVSLLREKAAQKKCFLFGGSIVEAAEEGLYNTSVLIDPKGVIIGQYRKIHLFGYQSEEARLVKRGAEISVVKTEIGALGLSTCYDLRFPELYRKMAVVGAEIFLVASAWPYPRLEAWLLLNRVRALENQAFLISSNCAGSSRGVPFVGHSMVVDPWGIPMVSGGDEECILEARLDIKKLYDARKMFPAFNDRVLA